MAAQKSNEEGIQPRALFIMNRTPFWLRASLGIALVIACGDDDYLPVSSCTESSDCERRSAELAASLQSPASPGDESLGSRACTGGGEMCECHVTTAGGSEVVLVRRRDSVCDLYSRGGPCLVGPFTGCVAAADCDAPCAELVDAYREDRARTFDVEVRLSECRSFGGGSERACVVVVDVDDRCYAFDSPEIELGASASTAYSCELSDDEILEMAGIHPD